MRLRDPRRREFRPREDEQQHRQPRHTRHHEAEQLARGFVGPLRVLEHDQRRSLARQASRPPSSACNVRRRFTCGVELRRLPAIAGRHIDELGEQRLVLLRRAGERYVRACRA